MGSQGAVHGAPRRMAGGAKPPAQKMRAQRVATAEYSMDLVEDCDDSSNQDEEAGCWQQEAEPNPPPVEPPRRERCSSSRRGAAREPEPSEFQCENVEEDETLSMTQRGEDYKRDFDEDAASAQEGSCLLDTDTMTDVGLAHSEQPRRPAAPCFMEEISGLSRTRDAFDNGFISSRGAAPTMAAPLQPERPEGYM